MKVDQSKNMEVQRSKPVYHLFVTIQDGTTRILRFHTPILSIETLTPQILNLTGVPQHHHEFFYLTSQSRLLSLAKTLVSSDGSRIFPSVQVRVRSCGGKGGFGSLLRGAATKAGQKKTNNFDACRDMSGRRLRHVNAEKKLEEWRMEEEGRKLEKSAEEFLKKNAKKAKGKVSGNSAEKYVEKYREVSAKCVAQVEVAVREALGSRVRDGKRKGVMGKEGLDAKRLKIWRGKRKMAESDSDDMDDDDSDNDRNEKSIVLNNGNHTDSSNEVEESSSLVSRGKLDGEVLGEGPYESGCEDEIGMNVKESSESTENLGVSIENSEGNQVVESMIHDATVKSSGVSSLDAMVVVETEIIATEKDGAELNLGNLDDVVGQVARSSSKEREAHPEANGSNEEKISACTNEDVKKPLNFDEYSSAAEMEVLGMECLKSELQACGLKCGGTLQERAARLFLLKTTPLEKLPKKLLAKK